MDKLLSPDFGLMFWTIFNFLILVVILGKFAWKPMLKMLEEREQKIAADKQQAENARDSAEKIKTELEERLKNISAEAEAKMSSVMSTASREKEVMLKEAKDTADNILKSGAAQLEAEKQKVINAARKEIVDISLLAAGKFISSKNTRQEDGKNIEILLKEIEEGRS